jgi:hypothetical protein
MTGGYRQPIWLLSEDEGGDYTLALQAIAWLYSKDRFKAGESEPTVPYAVKRGQRATG